MTLTWVGIGVAFVLVGAALYMVGRSIHTQTNEIDELRTELVVLEVQHQALAKEVAQAFAAWNALFNPDGS